MDIFIEIFKEEIFKRVQAVDGNNNRSSDETDYFSGHDLLKNLRKTYKNMIQL